MFGSYSTPLANWIGSGVGLLDSMTAKQSLMDASLIDVSKKEYEKFYKKIIENKKYITYNI